MWKSCRYNTSAIVHIYTVEQWLLQTQLKTLKSPGIIIYTHTTSLQIKDTQLHDK